MGCLGSIEWTFFIGKPCYEGNFLQRNPFVKYHGKTIGSHNRTVLNTKPCYNEMCYKETTLFYYFRFCYF